jgi:hypothetical protein
MSFNPYIYEKLITTRHEEIRHEIEQGRVRARVAHRPAPVPPGVDRHAALSSRQRRAVLRGGVSLS